MISELHHLVFRWLHVMAAVLWIGHLSAVVFGQQMRPAAADILMRAASGATPTSARIESFTTPSLRPPSYF